MEDRYEDKSDWERDLERRRDEEALEDFLRDCYPELVIAFDYSNEHTSVAITGPRMEGCKGFTEAELIGESEDVA